MERNCIIIGVAGGSGSGKTTIARKLLETFEAEDAVLVEQDAYYKELHIESIDERAKMNFDHPNAIEFELLRENLLDLVHGKTVERPIYDFSTHMRKSEKVIINPSRIIIVEGILIFAVPEIRELFDIKIFVDTDADEMLLRRMERDIKERGRTFESVRDQYLSTVKPMYLEFAEPSKRYADVIIPRGGENKVAINMVIAKMKRYLKKGAL
ncbi:MAG: uridine kinase [Fusobacteriaceae bacterium]|jgi:uridine kinase|nr:uridine kinase [Fusobacteriaceae bacterium]MBP6466409.1 uridine kinase [Fusobacteriaceae bacterium]MBP9596704.1 uridine kinase [Fusobacteriaceae bacterium]MBU9918603.1 uridine kinase [Fusobacteriaceae bacterium]